MAESPLDDVRRHSLPEQHGRVSMPQVMESHVAQGDTLCQSAEAGGDAGRALGLAVTSREHQIQVAPAEREQFAQARSGVQRQPHDVADCSPRRRVQQAIRLGLVSRDWRGGGARLS